jgi:hypothetical protein
MAAATEHFQHHGRPRTDVAHASSKGDGDRKAEPATRWQVGLCLEGARGRLSHGRPLLEAGAGRGTTSALTGRIREKDGIESRGSPHVTADLPRLCESGCKNAAALLIDVLRKVLHQNVV